MKIDETTLPARAKHALVGYGIDTVEQLAMADKDELMDVPNLGAKMIKVIERFIKKGTK